jgi:hypothetical protein
MLIDLFYAFYQLAFLGFVLSLVKRQRCAWGFLMLSCILKITTMQDLSNFNLSYLHYYLPETTIIIISMIGYVSYDENHEKNFFQKISLFKGTTLFTISVAISLLVYYALIYIITQLSFSFAPINFSIHLIEYIFTLFALLLAISKSPLAFASLFIAFVAGICIQIGLLIALPHYLSDFCFNLTYTLTLAVIVAVSYIKNRIC